MSGYCWIEGPYIASGFLLADDWLIVTAGYLNLGFPLLRIKKCFIWAQSMRVVRVRHVSKNETGTNRFDQPRYDQHGSRYDVNCMLDKVKMRSQFVFSGLLTEFYDNMLAALTSCDARQRHDRYASIFVTLPNNYRLPQKLPQFLCLLKITTLHKCHGFTYINKQS